MADGWKAVWGLEQVVAGRIEALEFRHCLDPAGRAPPLDENDEIDRFRDQAARDGCHGLLDQLLNSVERRASRVGVYCCNPAGVAGIPGLQHVEGFGSSPRRR
jgi:hypothetical protein